MHAVTRRALNDPTAKPLRLMPGEFHAHKTFDENTVNCGAVVFDCHWCGGIFESGIMLGGIFYGGEFVDGTFVGGVFLGIWRGGHWESGFDGSGSYRPRGVPPR